MGRGHTLTLLVAGVLLATALAFAAPADAAILPQRELTGPAGSVLDLGNVSVAEDGSGASVFVAQKDGVPHIFASLLRDGEWGPTIQVDNGQVYASSSPRVATGNGGRVVAVWLQRGPSSGGQQHDQLYSASIDPGAMRFENPLPIDLDVGRADYVTPDLSMNATGIAYLVYRIVLHTHVDNAAIPLDGAEVRLRVARYNGWIWSRLDQDINRNPATFVRFPSAQNAPKIVTDQYGNAIVAFQEPDDQFIARVWIRRVFGGLIGLPMMASPNTYDGAPLRGEADGISLDGGHFGNAAIAFRQAPGNPSRLDRSRVMMNQIGDVFTEQAGVLGGVKVVDSLPIGSGNAPGVPDVATNVQKQYSVGYAFDGEARRAAGDSFQDSAPESLGAMPTQTDSPLAFGLDDDGKAIVARATGPATALYEESTESGATVSADGATSVSRTELSVNDSGDGALATLQQSPAGARVVVDAVDSAPDKFELSEPAGWTRKPKTQLSWSPSYDGIGGLHYELRVDGRFAGSTTGTSLTLNKSLKDGRHEMIVSAIDRLEQKTAAPTAFLHSDRHAPRITVRRLSGRRVAVKITDGRRLHASGVSRRTSVSWGDGKNSKVSTVAIHKFKRGGTVKVRV
ncbi:MAG: hypothetical protein ACRDKI_10565, partial [Solirubrobacterales bacterium]